jgi:hypothetical protein
MVGQSLISSALSMLTRISKILFFSMMATKKQRNISCQSSSFSSSKALSLQANYINGNRSLSCILSRNMWKKMELGIYAGAKIFRWNFNKQTNSIEMQKAPIDRRSLLYTYRCMMNVCTAIIASYAIYCNTLMGCYV